MTGHGSGAIISLDMNRRGFLRAVGATGLLLLMQGPAVGTAAPKKTPAELIKQALAERRLLQFDYHGYSRQVEPHALGHVTEGRLALLAWQISGGSQSEPDISPRRNRIAENPAPDFRAAPGLPSGDHQAKTDRGRGGGRIFAKII